MKLTLAISSLAALAAGLPGGAPPAYGGSCLSQADAETLVARYASVVAQSSSDLGNATVTAAAITADNYSETSDSANIQINVPLGAVTVPSKQAFIIGSQLNPPVVFNTIAVYNAPASPAQLEGGTDVSSCAAVTWQWVSSTFGSGEFEVKGFHLFKVGADGLIQATYFEFNSIAGALDTGWTVLTPNGTAL